jgi:ribonuclease PH
VARGRVSGRTAEIQRLIGRSLRAVVDLAHLPNRTLTVDCDVLQADGGTRTAAITGGYVAMASALARLFLTGDLTTWPLRESVAAISVGLLKGQALLDLDYSEDVEADVDMNVVATGGRDLVEVQGTAEGRSFQRAELDALLDLALAGIDELGRHQRAALEDRLAEVEQLRTRGRRPRSRPKDEGELWGPPT